MNKTIKKIIAREGLIIVTLLLLISISCFAEEYPFVIDKDSVGGLKKGDSIDRIYELYPEEWIKMANLKQYAEGFFVAGMEISLPHAEDFSSAGYSLDVVIGEEDNGYIVSTINLYDKRFETQNGFNPGSTVEELKEKHELEDLDFYHGHMFITVKGIDGYLVSPYGFFEEDVIKNANLPLDDIPGDVPIDYIRLTGKN